jgi:RNA polymerase sigma-70 factor (ECF subfamily)
MTAIAREKQAANKNRARLVYRSVIGQVVTASLASTAGGTDPADRVETLFDTHHQRLYRLARRLSASADDARDLVQETFLRVARAPHAVPLGVESEEAWLVRVLVNLKRDEWRRTVSRKRLDPEGEAHAARAGPVDHEAALIAHTTVWRALERLPPRRRAVLVLYELEGATIPAIARLIGVTAVTVRWHLSLGRRELAAIIRTQEGQAS